ncbi:hypothetical protein DM01DRAFT_1338612 [Hesseltinella vesiculosa]|uniref:Xylanolytic transcriptional activator regulatory domain-containing protein n=1 Tax=Hesseltinella vesiculosa TaxID=101127 RepID=A0A1X2G9Q0_9FUNG|nr:hypothetical protein DM01DRAFT_1338612 [Hesseltinella vesiculosa]
MGAPEHSFKTNSYKAKKQKLAEERAEAKAKKHQQDDLDSLQITFYEIDAWIDKTTPVLNRMTRELDRVSGRFEQQKQKQQQWQQPPEQQRIAMPPPPAPSNCMDLSKASYAFSEEDKDSIKWVLSFQPGSSLRLETNITSVEQLVDAVREIHRLTETTAGPSPSGPANHSSQQQQQLQQFVNNKHHLTIPWIGSALHDSTEYWVTALRRRPRSVLEDYTDFDQSNINKLVENVSPHLLNYACQVYWDCLHPKFSGDWASFWERSGDRRRNQLCIDSGLAMVFIHLIRHNKESCPNANDIGYSYYERTRDALMDFFDSPDCSTLEAMMNLAMFCILCKRHPQARIHIGLAYRMILDMGIHRQSTWPKDDQHLRKNYLKLFMVLYYNDINVSMYSGEPTQVNDHDIDVDFYDLIRVNDQISPSPDPKTLAKETFFAHLLSLLRIGKRTLLLIQDYQRYIASSPEALHASQNTKQPDVPVVFSQQIQQLEIDLARWFDRLTPEYRQATPPLDPTATKPNHHHHAHDDFGNFGTGMNLEPEPEYRPLTEAYLQQHGSVLLMLQYQTQWLLLHKSFANIEPSNLTATTAKSSTANAPPFVYGPDRSREICTDAANRIVAMGQVIVNQFGWCACQQFMSCIYQASTVYCRNALSNNPEIRQHAVTMIKHIMRIMGSNRINYSGLPDDLTECLHDFLLKHGLVSPSATSTPQQQLYDPQDLLAPGSTLDDTGSFTSSASPPGTPMSLDLNFNDTLYNSPRRHLDCLYQLSIQRPALTSSIYQSDALLSIKIQDPMVDTNSLAMNMQMGERKNWRNVFSSSNITEAHQRIC